MNRFFKRGVAALSGPFIAAVIALTLPAVVAAQTPLPTVEGEVRKVDLEAQKITLRHGEIPNLGMDAMTMVFRMEDAALLVQVKSGDKVRFTADRVEGALTVLSIAPATEASPPTRARKSP